MWLEMNFPTPWLGGKKTKKKTKNRKQVAHARSIVQLCHWGSAQHKQRAEYVWIERDRERERERERERGQKHPPPIRNPRCVTREKK